MRKAPAPKKGPSTKKSAPARKPVASGKPSAASQPATARKSSAVGKPAAARRPAVAGKAAPVRKPGTVRSAAPAHKPAPVRKAAPVRRPAAPKGQPTGERLQKLLAHAGVASRRACEELILAGRVQVNGVTVTELGTRADPDRDEVTLDFVPIRRESHVYVLLNKPKGYVTTVKDDQGRPTVMALLTGVPGRLYPVGRLDFNSEGLLLLTNDGDLAQVMSGPDHEIPKVYLVKVHRMPTLAQIKELSEGFCLDGRRLKPCHIEVAERAENPWLKVALTEGKNQQIRRMFAAIGHPVSKLRRVQFGPIADPGLKPGAWRFLAPNEIAALKAL